MVEDQYFALYSEYGVILGAALQCVYYLPVIKTTELFICDVLKCSSREEM